MRARTSPRLEARSDLADWREEPAYEILHAADGPALAWEWLRRSSKYRRAAGAALEQRVDPLWGAPEQVEAFDFGLHRFEDPSLGLPHARPLWTAASMRSVISAEATRCVAGDDAFSLRSLGKFATVVRSRRRAHILLSDGLSMLRLDVSGDSPLSGPVTLRYRLEGLRSARPSIPPLLEFLKLAERGNFRRRPHVSNVRRQILLLRAFDALAAGASQRDIAAKLLSPDAAEHRWRIKHSSLKSRAQRLCKGADRMANGGFWRLLG